MPLLTDSPTNPDPNTGTRRVDLWSEPAGGGSYGDYAVGTAYSARYVSDDGHGCADVGIFVERTEVNGKVTYGVMEQAIFGEAEIEDGVMRPGDGADIEYELASQLAFETEEQAQKECDRLGQIDQSHALNLRKREV